MSSTDSSLLLKSPVSVASRDPAVDARIAVVVPAYRVKRHVLQVIASVPAGVERIYVVDDACPEGSGVFVEEQCRDPRVTVLRNPVNLGVGGAVMHGYRRAAEDGADVVVKIDGDGQMDPAMLPRMVGPILRGQADYTKGNRFYDLRCISRMPRARLFGNAVLSFMAKASSGYWDVFDPTNGYTAIHARVAALLPHEKISARYFFETDMLFRLGTFRAVVVDVPMDAQYGDEVSNLHIRRVVGEFLFKHIRNFGKRVFYSYFLRDLSIASLELVIGLAMVLFGVVFGAWQWYESWMAGMATPAGTVMLAVVPVLVGLQLLLAFFAYDIASVPRLPLADRLAGYIPGRGNR
ncbi:glycosyltransferase family 2 protein [Lysobacter korlensis]|uniref:Glycosyltransferase family 2 protein n=1 Tax=Lysobacter korlensis TaxID=553636 RepID=A0ABV6RLS6_9GAMM